MSKQMDFVKLLTDIQIYVEDKRQAHQSSKQKKSVIEKMRQDLEEVSGFK
jgi:hypothetical protein